MSWLSTSLSENLTNITGQISTFTKDMLTEGTVEVDGKMQYFTFLFKIWLLYVRYTAHLPVVKISETCIFKDWRYSITFIS
jgi:hypothetical protein